MFENYSDIMTVSEMAQALGIGMNSAYKLINGKSICSTRIGRKIIIPKKCLIDFILSTNDTHNTEQTFH